MRFIPKLQNIAGTGPTTPAPAATPPAAASDAAAATTTTPAAEKPAEKAADPAKPADPAAPAEKPGEEKPADDGKLGPRFQQLAKQEFALKQERKKFKEEREATEKTLGEKAKKYAAFETFDQMLKENPKAALELVGVDVREHLKKIARTIASGKAPEPDLADQVKELKDREAKREKDAKEAETKAQAAERTRIETEVRQEIGRIITAKKDDDFELLALEGDEGVEMVFEVLDLTAKKKGVILKFDEAAQQVESYLVKRARQIADAKKLKTAPAPVADPAAPPSQPASATANGHPKQKSPTLTAAHTSSTAPAPAKDDDEDFYAKTERLGKNLFVKPS